VSSDPPGPAPRPGLLTRLQPENWSVPVKLSAVLIVPILLSLVFGGLRIADQIHDATGLVALNRYVDLQSKVANLVGQLQRERDQAVVSVAGNRGGSSSARNVFASVDSAQADTEASVGDLGSLGGAPAAAYQWVQQSLGGLAQLRTQATLPNPDSADPDSADPNKADPEHIGADAMLTELSTGYTTIIDSLITFEASLDRRLDAPSMSALASGMAALSSIQEQLALQHTIIAASIANGVLGQQEADAVHTADARRSAATDQFRAGLDTAQQARYGTFISGQANSQFQQLERNALSHVGTGNELDVNAQDWDNAFHAVNEQLRDSVQGITDEIGSASKIEQAKSRNQAGLDSVILLLAMLAAAAVVYLVGRSLLRPLRVLRSTALEVAGQRLPRALQAMREGKIPDANVDPVPVTSLEEIGQVARAFDEVHGQAVKLAAEQATLQISVSNMFVNLSRRSQTLVERQLQLIERLERNEQDSEQLANLFQLDHLATRMRRNSENLLVLAGGELGKRGGAQVPVVDVLRAAVSEIEQYQRIVVQPPPPVEILGRAANDLVHLVAELLDNATSYSAPDTQVVIGSTRTSDGSLLVEIADQGVGMPAEELVSFNNRLAGQSEMDVSASRRMGLFVVGRLAARHGIGVRLASSNAFRDVGVGVTVSVSVPSALITAKVTVGERPGRASATERTGLMNRAESEDNLTMVGTAAMGGLTEAAPNGAPVNGAAVRWPGGVNGVNGAGVPPWPPGGLQRRAPGASMPPGGMGFPGGPGGQPPMPPGPPGHHPGPRPERNGMARERYGPSVSNGNPAPRHDPTDPPVAAESMPEQPSAEPGPSPEAESLWVPNTPSPAVEQDRQAQPGTLPEGESPIFEETSAWFRDNWKLDPKQVGSRRRGPSAAPQDRPEDSFEELLARSESVTAPVERRNPPAEPVKRPTPRPVELTPEPVARGRGGDASPRAPGYPSESERSERRVRADAVVVAGSPEPEPEPDGWSEQREPLLRPLPETAFAEVTAAGLPRRRPRAQLIPRGSGEDSNGSSLPAPVRSPEQVRGRLASYQSGVRQGRENRLRRLAEASNSVNSASADGNGKENS
jgi:signal transduction histidine kinase